MNKKKKFRKNNKFGNWTLFSYLGGGGNGEVWSCTDSNKNKTAIKLLKNVKLKSYNRFIDETFVIEKNSDIPGILPILDKYLPESINNEIPFYVMPIAKPARKILSNKSISVKINAIIQIAETLFQLHNRNIYHRDIKPANILVYKSNFYLADFGLVEYPNKKEISLKNEEIGAKWTMAPEMRRESSKADPAKADIYSLSKTLWIILTEKWLGFDGQYSLSSILELKKFYPNEYTSPIDDLLIKCTDNDPNKRPDINFFIDALKEWKELKKDFHKSNRKQWNEIQTMLFPSSIPNRVIWEELNDIVKILKIISSKESLNHMFFPDTGGLDLEGVNFSDETNCIELDCGFKFILKPKRLIFESFSCDTQWNYFRLETWPLESTGIYGKDFEKSHMHELVSEFSPLDYRDYKYLEYRYEYNEAGYEIPDSARSVTRYFRVSFVFFCKRSFYNMYGPTYDGRHDKMNTDEFKRYIKNMIDMVKTNNLEKWKR